MSYELLQLGAQPDIDAHILKQLYMSDGVDDAVVLEFGSTVTAYRELSHEAIRERLEEKYGGANPQAVGFIALIDNEPIAMVFGGLKDYQSLEGTVNGANVSAWVALQARGMGIGTELMRGCVSSTYDKWKNVKIWTSVDRGNIASQKMCRAVGFTRSHSQLEEDMENRDIYVL